MNIGILCETREFYGASTPSLQYCHLPSSNTVNAVFNILVNLGYNVTLADGIDNVMSLLNNNKIDIAFPISSSSGGDGRQIWMQSILEALNVPFVGSNARSILLSSDKYLTNSIAKDQGIPSIPSQVVIDEQGKMNLTSCTYDFPCIVKPNYESDSRGVFLAFNIDDLTIKAHNIWEKFKQKVICQPFINGKEITVSIYEENSNPKVFGMAEIICNDKDPYKIYSYQNKHLSKSIKKIPDISDKIYNLLCANSKKIFEIFGLHDYARIDYRLDNDNVPYLLEVTPTPSLPISASYFAAGQLYGYNTQVIINQIINSTIFRYRM